MDFNSMSPSATPVGADPSSPAARRPASRSSIPIATSSASIMNNADLSQGFTALSGKFDQECSFTSGLYQTIDANALVLQQVVGRIRDLELGVAAQGVKGEQTGGELANLRITTEEYLKKSEEGQSAALAQLAELDKRTDLQLRTELNSLAAPVDLKLAQINENIEQLKSASGATSGVSASPPPPPPGLAEEVTNQVALLSGQVSGLAGGVEMVKVRVQQLEANSGEMANAIRAAEARGTAQASSQDPRGIDPMQQGSAWDGVTLGGQGPRGLTLLPDAPQVPTFNMGTPMHGGDTSRWSLYDEKVHD